MMGRFCRWVEKVFRWSEQIARLSDSRPRPQIPTKSVFLSALMMFVTRQGSLNAMESQLRAVGRWEKVVGKRWPSADRMGQIVAQMDDSRLRDLLSWVCHRLRRIKALAENPWPLRFVNLDAHETFASRKRCCSQCRARQVSVGKKGNKREVTEYYHSFVVAHLIGFDLPIILDVEAVRPGEGEPGAAKRLLRRLLRRYARFFDAVQGDAIYWQAPLAQLCREKGKHLLAVLKGNNPALLADARALLVGEPDARAQQDERNILLWDQEGFAGDTIAQPLRVVRAEERWTRRQRVAGRWVHSKEVSHWFWATTIPQSLVPARQLRQVGHERWKIDNAIFNTLGAHWGMDHCFHHEPHAITNFILILAIAYLLLACFHRRNIKPPVRRRLTLIATAQHILQTILCLAATSVDWLRPRAP